MHSLLYRSFLGSLTKQQKECLVLERSDTNKGYVCMGGYCKLFSLVISSAAQLEQMLCDII